jgi:hypothetical protein
VTTWKERLGKYVWIVISIALFGPFAIVYALGFLDQPLPQGQLFGAWFMGALTISGVITTIGFAGSIRWHGWKELGCVLPIAAFTCFVGYVFLRTIGLLQ